MVSFWADLIYIKKNFFPLHFIILFQANGSYIYAMVCYKVDEL